MAAAGLACAAAAPVIASPSRPPGEIVGFDDLPGFASDDHAAALRVFRASCAVIARPAARSAVAAPAALEAACAKALTMPKAPGATAARAFFEAWFTPIRLPVEGFVTGYYEPVVEGSLARTAAYATPLYPRPPELVGIAPGRHPAGLDPALSAARRGAGGTLEAMPDRAAIEAGALGRLAPLVYVRDPAEAFFIQVQGSARIELPDGSRRRLVFDGRNGYPYTSIGKVLVRQLGIPPDQMGMAQLAAWIRSNGQQPGEPGAALMQRNRSYIFFRFDDKLAPDAGPIGGEGISLTPFRSLAVDRTIWSYGLPFHVDADLPWRGEAATPFQRLMVAQDTGAAIIGPARGDIFFGSGPEAARLAGPIRHPAHLTVLWPNAAPAGSGAP